jgi:uncharacterized membrane protein YdbT with pleckstrin-like domain
MLTEKIQLEADEMILIHVRKHWFMLFTQVFGIFFAALFPIIIYIVISHLNLPAAIMNALEWQLIAGLYSFWLLILWIALFSIWTNYYLDVWTVTTKRVVAIDQLGLFRRKTSSFRLERLQDITVEVNGILATFLDYGSLRAQTAGADSIEFIATGLPHPREFKSLILRAADETTFQTPAPHTPQTEV